jgi:hypothetical protein
MRGDRDQPVPAPYPPGFGVMNERLGEMDTIGPDPCGQSARAGDQKQKPASAAVCRDLPRQIFAVGVPVIAQDHHRAAWQLLEGRYGISLPLGIRYHDKRRQGRAVDAPRMTGGAIELERLLC